MSTHVYDALIVRRSKDPFGRDVQDIVCHFSGAHAYELAPALKQLAKKIHESPPPVVLDGQESIL